MMNQWSDLPDEQQPTSSGNGQIAATAVISEA